MKRALFILLLLNYVHIMAQVPKERAIKGDVSSDIYLSPVPESALYKGRSTSYYQKNGKYGLITIDGVKQEAIYDKIEFDVNGIIVKKDNLYGFVDKKGLPITKIEFDSIGRQYNDIYIVKKKDRYGTISSSGKPVLPIKYHKILFGDRNSTSFVKDKNGNMQMIFGGEEKSLSKTIEFGEVYANLIIVKAAGKFGIVKNKTFIPLDYDSIYVSQETYYSIGTTRGDKIKKISRPNFSSSNYYRKINFLTTQKNGKIGLIDNDGMAIYAPENDAIDNVERSGYYSVKKNNLFSIYFINTRKKTEIEFDKIYTDGIGYVMAVKNKKAGVFNTQGEQIVPFEYDNEFIAQYNIGLRVTKNKKRGIVDKKGLVIIPPIYDDIDPFYESDLKNFIKVKIDEKFGIINLQGDIIVPVKFEWIGEENGFFKVLTSSDNRKFGLYDKDGKIIAEPVYNWITHSLTTNSKLIILERDSNSYNFLDQNNKLILKENVSSYGYVLDENRLLNFYKNKGRELIYVKDKLGKFGVLNESSEKLVVPLIYDQIIQSFESSKHTYFSVKKGNKFGLINEINEIVIPISYDNINIDLVEGFGGEGSEASYSVIVSKNKKFGTVNLKNSVQIPMIYTDLQRISANQLYKAKVGKYYQIINSKNEVINKGPFDEVANFENTGSNYYSESPLNTALTFYQNKMSVINEKGKIITEGVAMKPHKGYKTFDELKFAFVTAMNSNDSTLLKNFVEKVAPSQHILYYLKQNIFDHKTPLRYTDISFIKEKYYNDLLRYKSRYWNNKSGIGYEPSSLTKVTDYTVYSEDCGCITNMRTTDHAFGDTRFMEKFLRHAIKVNGFWISSYFMLRNFDNFKP